MAINVSGRHLLSQRLAEELALALDTSTVDPAA